MKIRGNTVGTTMPRPNWDQTDPKKADYIVNRPVGAAEKSFQYGKNVQALTDNSVTFGADCYAGLLGYYFSKIDLANKKIVLTTAQQKPVAGTYDEVVDKDVSIDTGYSVGEQFSIVNGSHYDLCGTISAIDANVITYTTDGLGFTAISSVSELDYDDYTFAVPSQPDIGVAQVAKAAFALGTGSKATGIGSYAEGRDNLGVGNYSHVEGRSNVATYASHAEGQNTQAMGMRSHAEGGSTKTTANYAHAEGLSTTAGGYASHAEGQDTVTQGSASHAEGGKTQALSNYSHAEGYQTEAKGYASHTEGETTKATGIRSHAEGHNTSATENAAHAEGHDTVASAYVAHAEGRGCTASGTASHAEGQGAVASGAVSHAEGRDTKATADYAHVEGYSNTASGIGSHAEGFNSTASGPYSHAEGSSCLAYGYGGHAHGVRSYSHGAAQTVLGMHNRVDEVPEGVDETTVEGRTKYVVIVGNGTSSAYADRSNAATLDWEGNAWLAGGLILTSPNGTRYRITVNDDGTLAVAKTAL